MAPLSPVTKIEGSAACAGDAGRHAASDDPGSAPDPGSASCGDDHLEIFAGNHQRAIPGDVELVEQSKEVGFKRLLRLRINRRERLHDGTIVIAEDLDPMFRRFETKDKILGLCRDGRVRTEQRVEMRLSAPERPRLDAGG